MAGLLDVLESDIGGLLDAETGIRAGDLLPITGELFAAKDAAEELSNDQYGSAALSMLGAIPGLGGVVRVVTRGGKKVIKLDGDELGEWSDIRELKKKAIQYAQENFKDQPPIRNTELGDIHYGVGGVKHSLGYKPTGPEIGLMTPAVPEMLRHGAKVPHEALDKKSVGILDTELLGVDMDIAGNPIEGLLHIHTRPDGKRYYNHSVKKSKKPRK